MSYEISRASRAMRLAITSWMCRPWSRFPLAFPFPPCLQSQHLLPVSSLLWFPQQIASRWSSARRKTCRTCETHIFRFGLRRLVQQRLQQLLQIHMHRYLCTGSVHALTSPGQFPLSVGQLACRRVFLYLRLRANLSVGLSCLRYRDGLNVSQRHVGIQNLKPECTADITIRF